MIATARLRHSLLRMAGVTLGVGLATALLTAPAAAAPVATPAHPTAAASAQTPQLRIAVDDGRTSTSAGDQLAYTVTVTNLGTTRVRSLHVTQTAPSGLKLSSADSAGTSNASGVVWTVDLKANATATMHTKLAVSATPQELLRLATVACASLSANGAPIVCASHSDVLPAGVAAAHAAAVRPERAAPSSIHSWWYFAGAGGVLGLGAAASLVARRRKSRNIG